MDAVAVLVVRSFDTMTFLPPQELRVVRVLPRDGLLGRQYAWVEVDPAAGTGDPLGYAMTVRSGRRWRLPRPGKRLEMLAWRVRDPAATFAGDAYRAPSSGAVVCYLYDDTLEHQLADYRQTEADATRNGWPAGPPVP